MSKKAAYLAVIGPHVYGSSAQKEGRSSFNYIHHIGNAQLLEHPVRCGQRRMVWPSWATTHYGKATPTVRFSVET